MNLNINENNDDLDLDIDDSENIMSEVNTTKIKSHEIESQSIEFEETEHVEINNNLEKNEDCVGDETIQHEVNDESKKTDNDLICDYLKPNSRCILCTTPVWALKLNKAYLDGLSYNNMINEFSVKFEERTGRSLNKSLLHRHFKIHFDARAAAIAEYNKRRQDSPKTTSSTAQRDIFKLAANKYLDELQIFDAASKEMIVKYEELEQLIEEKRNNKKSGIDELILKQAQVLNALSKQAISKFKALSRVNLEDQQSKLLSQLSFIGHKALSGINSKPLLEIKETEDVYIRIVIKQILARLDDPLKITFGELSSDQKMLFYRELKKSIIGIEDGISIDFERQIKLLNEQKLISKDSKQT